MRVLEITIEYPLDREDGGEDVYQIEAAIYPGGEGEITSITLDGRPADLPDLPGLLRSVWEEIHDVARGAYEDAEDARADAYDDYGDQQYDIDREDAA